MKKHPKPTKEELTAYKNKIKVAANKFKVTERTIRRWMSSYGLYNPNDGPGKLDPKKAGKIRKLYRTKDYTQSKLADLFNVTQAAICKIINNKTYPGHGLSLSGQAQYTKKPLRT